MLALKITALFIMEISLVYNFFYQIKVHFSH